MPIHGCNSNITRGYSGCAQDTALSNVSIVESANNVVGLKLKRIHGYKVWVWNSWPDYIVFAFIEVCVFLWRHFLKRSGLASTLKRRFHCQHYWFWDTIFTGERWFCKFCFYNLTPGIISSGAETVLRLLVSGQLMEKTQPRWLASFHLGCQHFF